jgi:hypothetical protein
MSEKLVKQKNPGPEKTAYLFDHAKRNWQSECIKALLVERIEGDWVYKVEGCFRLYNFDNGRERGYTLELVDESNYDPDKGGFLDKRTVSFAENRNSDEIVIYPFEWNVVEGQVGYAEAKSESDWDKRVYLKPEKFHEAVRKIQEFLEIKDGE